MHKMPPTVPISNLRNDQEEILEMMDGQPVLLTQRGKARAALVNIEQWNHLMDVLEMYRAHWRAESAHMQTDMAEREWINADSMIDEWAAKHGAAVDSEKKKRVFGSAKGLIKIAPDFDDPLEDFQEYM